MFCTSSNVVGDTAVNTIVAKTEGEIGNQQEVEAQPAQANA
ncbi:transporter GltP [Vibrio parahaemolyticus K5030]|nr:transporter GltP [Vibrio parahaemolyticus K5030]